MRASTRVMSVGLGLIVDPRTIWAYPLYEETEEQSKILAIEQQIAEMPSDPLTELCTAGSLVAVRETPESAEWMRGRLVELSMCSKQVVATVFLIDYGKVRESLRVETCVREMPPGISNAPPLAFQILLAGLSPVTRDLDFMMGRNVMEMTAQRGWDQAAWREVEEVVAEVNGFAEVRNWVVDQRGRYQGQLYLVGERKVKRLHLNQLLQEKQFAVESQWQMENDLDEEAVDGENNREFKALVDSRSSDLGSWEVEYSNEAFGESEVTGGQTGFDDDRAPGREKVGECGARNVAAGITRGSMIGRGIKKREESREINVASIGMAGIISATRKDKAKEFLDGLKSKKVKSVTVKDDRDEVTDDDEFWKVVRGKPGSEDKSASHLLPGGVFLGRHHEAVLANIQAGSKQEQKKKFEQFVALKEEK